MGRVFSYLRTVLGLDALKRVGRKVQEDDCFGLAAQLAYFVVLSLFPFLMFVVAMVGVLVDDPESSLKTLTESMRGLLPGDAVGLLVDHIDRTLRGAGSVVLFFAMIATLWSGSAASSALIKASNRAYELQETRPLWKVAGISILMLFLFALLIGTLSLVILSSQTGSYLQRLTGLPDLFVNLWGIVRWVVAFAVVTFVHDVFYYMAPSTDLPFKWVTPGGLTATALILLSSAALSFYVANLGGYDLLYGQLGAVIVLILWLYVGSFMVIVGVEINAVLARMLEEREGAEIVRPERPADDKNYV